MPRFLGLVVGALAVMLFALQGGQAFAAHVTCGDVITQDTTLDSDLIDCPGDGLVIGADGVTLDLGGHTVDGTGTRLRHRQRTPRMRLSGRGRLRACNRAKRGCESSSTSASA